MNNNNNFNFFNTNNNNINNFNNNNNNFNNNFFNSNNFFNTNSNFPQNSFNNNNNNFFNQINNLTQMNLNNSNVIQNIQNIQNLQNQMNFYMNNIQNQIYNNYINSNYLNIKNPNYFPLQMNLQSNNNNNNNKIFQKTFHKNRRTMNTSNLYKMDNNEIAKNSFNLAKEQIGCRFLQKKIEEDTEFAITRIYPVLLDHLWDTITNQFGNYLIQKFFEYLKEEDLFQFTSMISSSFSNIGINQYGTRVIQKLIDYINNNNSKLYKIFVNLISLNIVLFSNDINGCHIIQKILLTKNFSNKFCYEKLDECLEQIANHKNGCCFIQKCTEKLKGEELEYLLNSINKKTKLLIVDQFGNYVVQHVLNINGKERNFKIFELLINDDITFYSNQKFSSNVLEKFFQFDEMKEKLFEILLNNNVMKKMLFDPFGNYVVQKALMSSEGNVQTKLLCAIAPLLEDLKLVDFGMKLYHKLTIKYPLLSKIVYTLNNN